MPVSEPLERVTGIVTFEAVGGHRSSFDVMILVPVEGGGGGGSGGRGIEDEFDAVKVLFGCVSEAIEEDFEELPIS